MTYQMAFLHITTESVSGIADNYEPRRKNLYRETIVRLFREHSTSIMSKCAVTKFETYVCLFVSTGFPLRREFISQLIIVYLSEVKMF